MTDVLWHLYDGPNSLPKFLEKLGVDTKNAEPIIEDWLPRVISIISQNHSRIYPDMLTTTNKSYNTGVEDGYNDAY